MGLPAYDFDLFTDAGIADPYEHYRAIRNLGSVVELPASNALAIGRFIDVKRTLMDHKQFVSGQGIALNPTANDMGCGTTLMSDPPLHQQLRKIIGEPLMPEALAELKQQIQLAADELIDRLVAMGSFDGIADLATFLPVSIVSNLVGLPEDGRKNMLSWAAAAFDTLGPPNDRLAVAIPQMGEMIGYIAQSAGPEQVRPGSWAARVYQAADQGLVAREQAPALLIDYLAPSLDTTIFAIGHMLRLLGQHPDQWRMLRENPELIPNAVNEVVRMESPIRGFSRVAAQSCDISGTEIPAGSRVLVLYASANRDERKWTSPESFNITRPGVNEQLGFGLGRHVCAGQHLARLEIQCLLVAMIGRIERFSTGEPVVHVNNLLRGYSSLPVKIH